MGGQADANTDHGFAIFMASLVPSSLLCSGAAYLGRYIASSASDSDSAAMQK
jgi:hypothetical protein